MQIEEQIMGKQVILFQEQVMGMEALKILWSDNTVRIWLAIFVLFAIHLVWSTRRYCRGSIEKESGYADRQERRVKKALEKHD